jgi:hypothetical protein
MLIINLWSIIMWLIFKKIKKNCMFRVIGLRYARLKEKEE